jgi:hypothetical protein
MGYIGDKKYSPFIAEIHPNKEAGSYNRLATSEQKIVIGDDSSTITTTI